MTQLRGHDAWLEPTCGATRKDTTFMKYKQLGASGRLVPELGRGTMPWGGRGRFTEIGTRDQSNADRIAARSLEAGINFVYPADVYSEGLSEEITGRAIAHSGRKRTDVVLATKVFLPVRGGPNERGASRGHIMDGIQASLKRLGTDYVDLYQIHGLDTVTPIEETVRALDDLVRQGSVRYIGVSNWLAWTIMKALGIADNRGWTRLSTLQAYYTIAGRDIEREIVPLLEAEHVGLMVWSPLAGGLLSGKYDREGKGPHGSRRVAFDFPPVDKAPALPCIDIMLDTAQVHGVSVAPTPLPWVLHQPFVTPALLG